jgi:hypothetical protein
MGGVSVEIGVLGASADIDMGVSFLRMLMARV